MLRYFLVASLVAAVTCRPTVVKRRADEFDSILDDLERSLRKVESEPSLSPLCHDENGDPKSTGPFEKPNDCDHFYQCSNGYLYVRDCAPGTVYNPAIRVCDHPWNVTGCGRTTEPPTPPTTTPPTVPPFHDDCLDANGNPLSGEPFRNPDDCNTFFQCSNGYRYTFDCPDGLVFNPGNKVCDWPWNVTQCGGNPTNPPTTTPPPTQPPYHDDCVDGNGNPLSGEPFRNPDDCTTFFQCSNGYRYTHNCPDGLVFNPGNKVCDWPWNVTECGGNPTDPPTTTPPPTQPPHHEDCVDSNGNPLSGEPFRNPDDCKTFFQCSNGYRYTHNCPDGLVFNPGNKVCDWPWNVTECGGNPTDPPTTTPPPTQPPYHEDCIDNNGNPLSGEPFRNPDDCKTFFQCSNGYRYIFDCPEGLVFNPGNKVCDWPWNVTECGGNPTDPPTTTPPPSQPPYHDDCVDGNGNPLSGEPFRNPEDCTTFFQCSNGYRYTHNCPDGLVFNPGNKVCDWPWNVTECGGNPTDPPTTTTPPTQPPHHEDCVDANGNPLSGEPFRNPDDCETFFQCSNGYRYTHNCPDGLVFNPGNKVCDWPWNVTECGGNPTDPPTTTPPPTQPPHHEDCVDANGNPLSGEPFRNPDDCETFFQCSNGHRYTHNCPDGLVFNPGNKVCDWPWNVTDCGGNGGSGGSTEPPSPTPTQPPYDDICVDGDGNPISGEPFKNQDDCTKFFQCSNGYVHEFDCPDGTVFNPVKKVCDWPQNVPECGGGTNPPSSSTPPPTPSPHHEDCVDNNGNPISGEPFRNPDDCETFFQCSNGHRYKHSCPDGLVFNPGNKVCDWPWNVTDCDGGSGSGGPSQPTTTRPPYDVACVDGDGNPISGEPFKNPDDCEKFFQCSNGYVHEFDCPDGTVFNPANKVCDWPQNVPECGGGTEPPSSTPPPLTLPAYHDDCVDNAGNPLSGEPFRNPDDCTKFYQCSNGYRYTHNCPDGLVFNPGNKVCDWPWNVTECGGNPTDPPTTTPPPTQRPHDVDCVDNDGNPLSGEPFRNPDDCTKFYQCSNGYRYTHNCPDGLVFNPGNKVCDWPWNVTECGGNPTDPPTTTPPPTQPPHHDDCVDANGNPLSGEPFRNPDDCNTFFQCSNGYRYTHNCPDGLVFNPGNKVCDWPWNVTQCGGNPTDPPTTTPPPTQRPHDDDCVDNDGNLLSGEPFRNPDDCTKFYQCSNGYRYTHNCPDGLVFNPGNKVCDWPWNVTECGGKPTNPPTTTPPPDQPEYDEDCLDKNGNPISSDPFEKDDDCFYFYQCSNGYRHIMPCAPGTAFNPAIGVCDYPYNVPGCSSGGDIPVSTEEQCESTWSRWYNTHHPEPSWNSGDFETISNIEDNYGSICGIQSSFITGVECVCEGTGQDWTTAGDIMTCDIEDGLKCANANQTHGYACLDYKIRFFCLNLCDTEVVNVPSCKGSNGEPLSTGPLEKPGDCYHFYQCGAGILYTMDCAPGTVFNPKISVCDWPQNVPGC